MLEIVRLEVMAEDVRAGTYELEEKNCRSCDPETIGLKHGLRAGQPS